MASDRTQPEIALAIDDYGKYARASYFADYLEFRAFVGDRLPLSQLVDTILENNWGRRDLTLATVVHAYEEAYDEAKDFDDEIDSIAARIADVLLHRKATLANLYPFSIEGSGRSTVLIRELESAEFGSYLPLLAITLAHSTGLAVSGLDAGTVEDAFEALVRRRFDERGLPCVVVPTYGRYEDKIAEAVGPIGLAPDVGAAVRSKRAKDGGTDLVCNPPYADPRNAPGFVILGQATCGTADSWSAKAKEPDVAAWRRMLSMDWDPIRFLAVPHHVDRQYWPLLSQESGCVVIDRIRLVAMGESVTEDSVIIAQAVLGELPTGPRG